MARALATLLLSLSLSAGCAHRVDIHSEPPGATIKVGKRTIGPAPQQVRFLWWPGRAMRVKIEARDYRPLVIEAGNTVSTGRFILDFLSFRYKRILGLSPRTTINVLLVREHPGAGGWTPTDVKP